MERKKNKLTLSDEMKVYNEWRIRAIKRIPVVNKLVVKLVCFGLLTNNEKIELLIKWKRCKYKLTQPSLNMIEFWCVSEQYTSINRMLNTSLLRVNKLFNNNPILLN